MEIQDEIERKFLMRYIPSIITFDDIIYIEQYYVMIDGKPHRVRFSYDCDGENKGDFRCIEFIHKEKVGLGHNKEHHQDISKREAMRLIKDATRVMRKIRNIVKGDFKYEIDTLEDAHLIMMEVEVPKLDQILAIPNEIADNILCEVTGDSKFDNYNLATILKQRKRK